MGGTFSKGLEKERTGGIKRGRQDAVKGSCLFFVVWKKKLRQEGKGDTYKLFYRQKQLQSYSHPERNDTKESLPFEGEEQPFKKKAKSTTTEGMDQQLDDSKAIENRTRRVLTE